MPASDMVKICAGLIVIIVVVVFFAYGGADVITYAVEEWHDVMPTPTPTPTPVVEFKEVVGPIFGIIFVCVIIALIWILWDKFGPDAGF